MEDLTDEQIIALNLSIGDGYIRKNHGYSIVFTHSPKQLDYLQFKKELLENTDSFKKSTRRKKDSIDITYIKTKLNDKVFNQVRYTLTNISLLKPVFNILIKDGKKQITPEIVKYFNLQTLCLLMCDDGGVVKSKRNRVSKKTGESYIYYAPPTFRINLHSFSESENQLILKWLKDTYEIEGRLNTNKGCRIPHFNSKNAKKIFELILPFINKFESMKEKFKYCYEYWNHNLEVTPNK